MLTLLSVFFAGLVVGWNFFPQPAFVAAGVVKLVAKIKSLFAKKA